MRPRRRRPIRRPSPRASWCSPTTGRGSTSTTGACGWGRAGSLGWCWSRDSSDPRGPGRPSRAGCPARATRSWRICAATVSRMHRPAGSTSRRSRPTCSWSPRARGCSIEGRLCSPVTASGLGRGRGGRAARPALRRRRPGGRRLGASRGDHRGRCGRLPARSRRAAGGPAHDGCVPRGPTRLRSRDVGHGPGARRAGCRRGDGGGARAPGGPPARDRCSCPGDVRIRARRDAGPGHGPGHRARRAGVRRDRCAPRRAAAHRFGASGRRQESDPGRRLPVRRPQPDPVSAGGGLRRDPDPSRATIAEP